MGAEEGGGAEEEEAHWVGTVTTSSAIAGNVDAGESQVLFRPHNGRAEIKGGWNSYQPPQPAISKREDKRADDADADANADADADADADANANADAEVNVDGDGDGDVKADNDDVHQDALEMLTSILKNQGALQNQNQSSQQPWQLSASPDAAAKIEQMMQQLKMAERAAAAGGAIGRGSSALSGTPR